MTLLKKNKKQRKLSYEPSEKVPVILTSICTGEENAGLQNVKTGKFEAVMAVHNDQDLKEFQRLCGTEKIKTIY